MCALKVLEETTVKPALQFAIGSAWKLGCGMPTLRLLQQISSSGASDLCLRSLWVILVYAFAGEPLRWTLCIGLNGNAAVVTVSAAVRPNKVSWIFESPLKNLTDKMNGFRLSPFVLSKPMTFKVKLLREQQGLLPMNVCMWKCSLVRMPKLNPWVPLKPST